MENKNLRKFLFLLVFLSAILTFSIHVYFSPQRYFMGDDFPLLLSAQSFQSILQPVGVHFRPILRIHFILNKIFRFLPTPFNFLSLILHILASYSLYLVVKEEINRKIALLSSIIFFMLFAHNEAVYWISAVGVVYSLLFSMFSLYFFKKNHSLLSLLFLILAFLSYETWIALPFYYILSRKKNLSLIIASILLLAFQFIFTISLPERLYSYGGFPPLREIPSRIFYYFYKNFFPFSYVSSSPIVFLLSFLFVLFSVFLVFKNKEMFLFPFLFYFVPSGVFLFSYYIPSRFFYFPEVSFAIVLSLLFFEKKIWRLISLTVIVYIAIISPIINYLDGLDYLHYSIMHKSILEQGERLLEDIKPGDKVLLINKFSSPLPQIFANSVKGCPKIFLHRGRGIGGLIDLEIFTNFLLWKRGMRSMKLDGENEYKRIIIGDGDFVSEYFFKVVEMGK